MTVVKAQPPTPPCFFSGSVKINESPAPDGLNVTAVVKGTTLKWSTETKDGAYGPIEIPSDNQTTPQKDGGRDGDIIEFYVKGIKANQTGTFEMMRAWTVNLSISEPSNNPYPFDPVSVTLVGMAIALVVIFLIYKKRISRKNIRRQKRP